MPGVNARYAWHHAWDYRLFQNIGLHLYIWIFLEEITFVFRKIEMDNENI
jgi:hypothetical protein